LRELKVSRKEREPEVELQAPKRLNNTRQQLVLAPPLALEED